MNRKNFLEGKWVPYTIASCSAVLVYLFFSHIPGFFGAIGAFLRILEPIIIGIIIAYLVTPLIQWFELHLLKRIHHDKVRYNLAMILSLVLIAVLLGLLMSLLIPQIVASVIQFVANINFYSAKLSGLLQDVAEEAKAMNLDISGLTAFSDNILNEIASLLSRNANKIINSSFTVGGKSINILIGIILALYFLSDKSAMLGGIDRLCRCMFNEKRYTSLLNFMTRCNVIMGKYVVGDVLDAIIVGVINAIFMLITGMPYAVLISVVVGVTNLAPTFGPFVGAFIGAFILIFAEPVDAAIFLIFTFILQMLDGYVIKPRLFGGTLGVPGVWIVIGVIVGGKLFGVMGILLAIPFVAILNFIYHDFVERREMARRSG
jgi:predicted PurR-regulated permease PerM